MKCRVKLEVVGETWVFVSNIENTIFAYGGVRND
jgi:hypothetical protein